MIDTNDSIVKNKQYGVISGSPLVCSSIPDFVHPRTLTVLDCRLYLIISVFNNRMWPTEWAPRIIQYNCTRNVLWCQVHANILDLIFSDNEWDVSNLVYLPAIGKGHHVVLFFDLPFEASPTHGSHSYDSTEKINKFMLNKGDLGAPSKLGATTVKGFECGLKIFCQMGLSMSVLEVSTRKR